MSLTSNVLSVLSLGAFPLRGRDQREVGGKLELGCRRTNGVNSNCQREEAGGEIEVGLVRVGGEARVSLLDQLM